MNVNTKNRIVLKSVLVVIIIFLVTGLNYYFQSIENTDTGGNNTDAVARDIETDYKLWSNGYLGLFFNFKSLGNIYWIAVPLCLLYFFLMKPTLRWEKGLLLFYILAFTTTGVFGYYNSRYSMSLVPFTLVVIAYTSWKLCDKYLSRKMFYLFIFLLFILAAGNNSYFLINKLKKATTSIDVEVVVAKPDTSYVSANESTSKHSFWIDKLPGEKIPTDLIVFLSTIEPGNNNKVLVNELPFFFYYTDFKGIYYWCGDDMLRLKYGFTPLLANRGSEEAKTFLTDSLQCAYILSTERYNEYNLQFMSFIQTHCDTVYSGKSDPYVLYKIRF